MMKTLLFLLSVWAVLGLVQCKKDADVGAELGQKIELRLKQSIRVATYSADVRLTVTKLADSRCPINADCIWQGQADVDVELRDETGTVRTVALCLGACKNDSVAVVLDAVPYWLRLTAVDPYPSFPAGSQPQTATLYLTGQ